MRSRLRSQSRAQLRAQARSRSRLTEVNVACSRQPVSLAADWEGSEWFLGGRGTGVLIWRQKTLAMLRTGYPVPDIRIPCGEPLPSACACLAPTCRTEKCPASEAAVCVCVCLCVCAVVKCPVTSLPYLHHHLDYNVGTPPQGRQTWSDQPLYFTNVHHGRNPQAPMS